MNNLINTSKHDLSQTNITAVTSIVSSTAEGVDPAVAVNSAEGSSSFLKTFLKISDQPMSNGQVTTNEEGGNNLPTDLPLNDVLPEMSAENDHVLETSLESPIGAPLGILSETTNISDANLLVAENDHLILNSNTIDMMDENQTLKLESGSTQAASIETTPDITSIQGTSVDVEQRSVSSLAPSYLNVPLSTSSSQPSEVVSPQLQSVSASKITVDLANGLANDLNHVDPSQTVKTNPVSIPITPSATTPLLQETPATVAEGSLEQTLKQTERVATHVVSNEMKGNATKDTATKDTDTSDLLNKVSGAGGDVLQTNLSSDKLASDKAVSNVMPKGEVTNAIQQKIIDSPTPKQSVEPEISVLQGDLVSVDDIIANTKQNLYNQKSVGTVEQQRPGSSSIAPSSITSSLSNIHLNNLEVTEQNKSDLALSSTTKVSNQSEEAVATAVTVNGLSAELRAILQTRVNTKISQPGSTSLTLSDNSSSLDKSLMQTMDVLSLSKESFGIVSDKILNFSNMLSQQQLVATTQASQIAPVVQAATNTLDVDNDSDSLLGITTPTLNSSTNVNSFTLPQAQITEFFGRPAWHHAMGKQVISMINQNIGSAEIRLNPAHLGPIEVLIDMSEDQVNVSLSSRHAVVREAMEQALPRLREMLDDNGFNLADADISQHSFAEQREQNTKHNNHATEIAETTLDQLTPSDLASTTLHRRTESTGTVDYFV